MAYDDDLKNSNRNDNNIKSNSGDNGLKDVKKLDDNSGMDKSNELLNKQDTIDKQTRLDGVNDLSEDEVVKSKGGLKIKSPMDFIKSLLSSSPKLKKRILTGALAGSIGFGSLMGFGFFDDDDGSIVVLNEDHKTDNDCMEDFMKNLKEYASAEGDNETDAETINRAKLIYSYFKSAYNMSDEKIAAILGNWEEETSTFNPSLVEGDPSGRIDPYNVDQFNAYSLSKRRNSYYDVPSRRGGYTHAVGVGIAQTTGETAVDFLLKSKALGRQWNDLAYQLAYYSMKGSYRSGFIGDSTSSNYFEYFAKTDYSSSEQANSGKHPGFGRGKWASGGSKATHVTEAFDGKDVGKLTRIFCAGYEGWKDQDNYERRTRKAEKWLALIGTFEVDKAFADSVLAMANVSVNKAREGLLNPADCNITSTNYDNSSIAMAALSMAYAEADKAHNDGTPLYRKVFNAIIGRGPIRSCASLVASAVLWSGVDDNYPKSNDVLTQARYLVAEDSKGGKWKKINSEIMAGSGGFDSISNIVSHLQPGDIIVWKTGFPTGDGSITTSGKEVSHIVVYTGKELVVKKFGAKYGNMNTVEASYSSVVSKQRSAALGSIAPFRVASGSPSRANFQVYRCVKPQSGVSKYKNIGVEGGYNLREYVGSDHKDVDEDADKGEERDIDAPREEE